MIDRIVVITKASIFKWRGKPFLYFVLYFVLFFILCADSHHFWFIVVIVVGGTDVLLGHGRVLHGGRFLWVLEMEGALMHG